MSAGAGTLNIDFSDTQGISSVLTSQGGGMDVSPAGQVNNVLPSGIMDILNYTGSPPFVPPVSSSSSDPMGISSTIGSNNSANNPNPTGGWELLASSILNNATKAFSTFVSGSPSAAVPGAKKPTGMTTSNMFTTSTGQTNWALIVLIIAASGLGIWAIVKFA
jgi:hypothetical protein